jgi:hypothetical protein
MNINTKKNILVVQGGYYFITGLWPLLHLPSFVAVTGPKDDYWLVKLVALLSTSAAITMLSTRNEQSTSLTLNLTFAFSFLLIDVFYVLNGTISKIYLGDAFVELGFILLIFLHYSILREGRKAA